MFINFILAHCSSFRYLGFCFAIIIEYGCICSVYVATKRSRQLNRLREFYCAYNRTVLVHLVYGAQNNNMKERHVAFQQLAFSSERVSIVTHYIKYNAYHDL